MIIGVPLVNNGKRVEKIWMEFIKINKRINNAQWVILGDK